MFDRRSHLCGSCARSLGEAMDLIASTKRSRIREILAFPAIETVQDIGLKLRMCADMLRRYHADSQRKNLILDKMDIHSHCKIRKNTQLALCFHRFQELVARVVFH